MVSPVHGDYRRLQAETPLSDLFKFAEPALASRISELEKLRNRVANAERKPYGASRIANKKAVYEAAGLVGQ
jgi:hypothetical protein